MFDKRTWFSWKEKNNEIKRKVRNTKEKKENYYQGLCNNDKSWQKKKEKPKNKSVMMMMMNYKKAGI